MICEFYLEDMALYDRFGSLKEVISLHLSEMDAIRLHRDASSPDVYESGVRMVVKISTDLKVRPAINYRLSGR